MAFLPDLVTFCESLGFEFSLSIGDVLEIDAPAEWWELRRRLLNSREIEEGIIQRLKIRAANARQVCIGGPWDGAQHGLYPGRCVCEREAPQRWIVYVVLDNWSARFLGYATSEKKARGLAAEVYIASRAK